MAHGGGAHGSPAGPTDSGGHPVDVLGPWFQDMAGRVDAFLDRRLPSDGVRPARLHEAMRYAVFSGGKRLRPVLVLAASRAAGGSVERALPAAAAVELIHSYSLVHDDLPSMDDDVLRRGRPTVHVAYGEAQAILTGDALLTLAFELVADDLADACGAPVAVAVGRELSRAAGSTGLIAGQVEDLAAEGRAIDGRQLEAIHRAKTGALFEAALRVGGLVAGASHGAMESLTRFGRAFGLAFQIVDDILDVIGDARRTGRPAGRDEARGKATFPALFGLQEARRRAEQGVEEALAALEPFGAAGAPLAELARYVGSRDR